MNAIEVKELSKEYEGNYVVDHISFYVPEGSVFGFIGPNGAGKTTTLNMLTGLRQKTSGSIRYFGEEVDFKKLKTRFDFGYLPDVPGYYHWMTAKEFLYLCGKLFGMEDSVLQSRINMLLKEVGLENNDKKLSSYSRGMKQRVGIAQALIHNPKIIFLDEPVSALDPIGRKDIMDIIRNLSKNVTVFFSSHILSDVETICDRIAILNHGKIEECDTIRNVKKKYSVEQLCCEIAKGDVTKLVNLVKEYEWVNKVDLLDERRFVIDTKDIKETQQRIMKLSVEEGIYFQNFSVTEKSLDDIFMEVVTENE
ncbi:ABC transporter ATP-binding protein [Clostridium sp. UBA1652]|uniref:ABC transporter ATP-binding protein n=1 Tax=Clostridium sp. UBA1652 TaxID=1946348 RepID=UPI00257BEE10|nr:ABC transporter ATP-binding protein [Clostridium sp. UBA1652]